MQTFFWHDYETFGADPRRDRPAQFAGLRTDENLEPLGEPVNLFCRPPEDYVPSPEACAITGIAPQDALGPGLPEREFAAAVHAALARPGTCGVGYNSIRFDDEFTRFLLYRNFHDPYAREWEHGNSRWDLIDVARLCYALRPAGVAWPEHAPGRPSFRLEDLAAANDLSQGRAHDALADVEATVALARLLRRAQPRLFDYCLELRDKRVVRARMDLARRTPLVHVSSRFAAERGCLAVVLPLAEHPRNSNAVIAVDLAPDPAPLLELDVEDLRERVFTARADLPEELERVPLKAIAVNKCPVIAPLGVLRDADHDRIGLDLETCLAHGERLRADPELAARARAVFDTPWEGGVVDPEEDLYGAFLPDADRALLPRVRAAAPEELDAEHFPFSDARYPVLLERYRARNFPESLDAAARERWRRRCLEVWGAPDSETGRPAAARALAEIDALREGAGGAGRRTAVLDRCEAYLRERATALGLAIG